MQLSIIIVSWNTRQLLQRCLASIFDEGPPPETQVIVVDNASSDGSAAMVRAQFAQVVLIVNHENIGFGRANNQAYQQAVAANILLLNPDTELRNNAIATLLTFFQTQPQAAAAGARLLNSDGSLQQSVYRPPTLLRELWYLLHLDRLYPLARVRQERWSLDKAHEVEVIKGACLLLRREALGNQPLFDERFFMYSEEVDLCRRLQEAGWGLYWVPQAEVVHHEGQSTQLIARTMFLQLYQSKLLYFRKYYGNRTAVLYKLILLLAATLRLALMPLTRLESAEKRQHHLLVARRYWALIRQLPTI